MSSIKEIVAAEINGSIITNNFVDIVEAAKQNRVCQYLDRKHMQFMDACDLGSNWENLAKSKTLFYVVDGQPMFSLRSNDEVKNDNRNK